MDIFKLFSEHYCNHRGYMGHTLPNGILLGEDVEQGMEGYSGYGCSFKYERPSRTWDDWQKCCEENCPFMRKLNRIPAKWLDLEVFSWSVGKASSVGVNPRRYRNVNFHGERLRITALPSGESLEVKEKTSEKSEATLPGQMSIDDFLDK